MQVLPALAWLAMAEQVPVVARYLDEVALGLGLVALVLPSVAEAVASGY